MTSTAIVPIAEIERMALAFSKSGLFGTKTPDQAMALLLLAQAEGQHPALAMRDFDVIQGKPAKKAEAMLRSFIAAGGSVEWHQLDDTVADATFSHPQGGKARIAWDMERAKKAGLTGKDNWQKYGRAMLRSRTVSEGCRTVYPAATSGLYVPEEVRDIVRQERTQTRQEKDMGTAVVVDADGFITEPAKRDGELASLCTQAAISPKFYLNRAGVESASQMTDEDWTECVAVVKRKIKSQQDKAAGAQAETPQT